MTPIRPGWYRRADCDGIRLRIDSIHHENDGIVCADVAWQKAVPGVPGGWRSVDVERYFVLAREWVATVAP